MKNNENNSLAKEKDNKSIEQLVKLSPIPKDKKQIESITLNTSEESQDFKKWTALEESGTEIKLEKQQETLKIAETVNNNDTSTAPRMTFNQKGK